MAVGNLNTPLAELSAMADACAVEGPQVAIIRSALTTSRAVLLDSFLTRHSDMAALTATAKRAEHHVPYGALTQFDALSTGSEDTEWPSRLKAFVTGRKADQPVLIHVDDAQHLDQQSLNCLLALLPPPSARPLMLVFGDSGQFQRVHPHAYARLVEQPGYRVIRLRLLGRVEVAAQLAEVFGPETSERLSIACHRISAGNPILLHGLIDDSRDAVGPLFEPVIGPAFREAVLACIYRSEPLSIEAVRGLAVLPDASDLHLLSRLIQAEEGQTARTVEELDAVGLLEAGRFRHPDVRRIVLDDMPGDLRRSLHERSAELQQAAGAPLRQIADQLVAAHDTEDQSPTEDWVPLVLREAARQALTSVGEGERAARYLQAAYDTAGTGPDRQAIQMEQLEAEWRSDPGRARWRLTALVRLARRGELDDRALVVLVNCLLWHGQVAEAAEIVDLLRVAAERRAGPEPIRRSAVGSLAGLSYLYPKQLGDPFGAGRPALHEATGELVPDPSRWEPAVVLARLFVQGPCPPAVEAVEQVMQGASLAGRPLVTLAAGLAVLVHGDRLDLATDVCNRLIDDAIDRADTVHTAVLRAVRGLISLRRGYATRALADAHSALSLLSPPGWGVMIGLPLSVAMMARTILGQLDGAEELRIRTPSIMSQTPAGSLHLWAMGHHELTSDRPYAALQHFQACGQSLIDWGLDSLSLIPWRLGAARAYVVLDRPEEVRALVEEQLANLGSTMNREKGEALRLLAAASQPAERESLLQEAVAVLEGSEDRLGLALAAAELSRARRNPRSRPEDPVTEQYVHALLDECGLTCLGHLMLPWRDGEPSVVDLSLAERRVAELAGHGRTNREISLELNVTVSTVEQHLTRIYRKLKVRSRNDLTVRMRLG